MRRAVDIQPEPVEPKVQPQYRRHACLVEGAELLNFASKTHAEIASAAGHHVNTVSKKLRGERGQFNIIHDVFTAINMLQHNEFQRSRYVWYHDEDGTFKEDKGLDACLLFPKLRRLGLTSENRRQMGNQCGVRTPFIDHMIAGRPVCEQIVRTFFTHLQVNTDLDLNENYDLVR